MATGDDLEELRGSLEEEIRLIQAAPGGDMPDLRLSDLEFEPGGKRAGAELLAA